MSLTASDAEFVWSIARHGSEFSAAQNRGTGPISG